MTQQPEALYGIGALVAVARVCQSFLNFYQQLEGAHAKVPTHLARDIRHPASLDFPRLFPIYSLFFNLFSVYSLSISCALTACLVPA